MPCRRDHAGVIAIADQVRGAESQRHASRSCLADRPRSLLRVGRSQHTDALCERVGWGVNLAIEGLWLPETPYMLCPLSLIPVLT